MIEDKKYPVYYNNKEIIIIKNMKLDLKKKNYL